MKAIRTFFSDVVSELKKVVWPSRDKVMDATRVVIVSTIILALFFGAVDFLLVIGVDWVF